MTIKKATKDSLISHSRYKRIAFFSQPQGFYLPLSLGLHGSIDIAKVGHWRKDVLDWKVTLPSALIFAAKDVCTINFTTGFFFTFVCIWNRLRRQVAWSRMLSFLFCGQTLRNCPSRNSTLFSSRRSILLNQLRQRSFSTNFPHITGLFLQLKMVGLINLALVFRYREFPNVLSLFQYALFQRMWRQANASNTFSLAALCQGKNLR